MRKKENIFATTLRIDTETPEGSQAVTWLKSRDKKEYPSYSDLITEAVNFFCGRRLELENDPYLETRQKEDRFLQQMEERIAQAIRQQPSSRRRKTRAGRSSIPTRSVKRRFI